MKKNVRKKTMISDKFEYVISFSLKLCHDLPKQCMRIQTEIKDKGHISISYSCFITNLNSTKLYQY